MTIRLCEYEALCAELDEEPGGVLLAHLHGELDLSTAPALDRALHRYLDASHARRMLLDLRDVSFLDCHGVAVLVRLAHWATTHEGCERPCLIGLSSVGRRVLELVEVIDMFAVHDTIEGALAGTDRHETTPARALEGAVRCWRTPGSPSPSPPSRCAAG